MGKEKEKRITRREFLKGSAAIGGGMVLAGCVPPQPSTEVPTGALFSTRTPFPAETLGPTKATARATTEALGQTEVFETFEEAIETSASFSERGSLDSESGRVEVNYSDALLDGAGIQSIRLDGRAMDESWQTMFNLAYELAGRQVGTPVQIRGFMQIGHEIGRPAGLSGVLANVDVYAVTRNEFDLISSAFKDVLTRNGTLSCMESSAASTVLVYFDQNGELNIVSKSRGLSQSSRYGRERMGGLVICDGFNEPGWNIVFGANTRGGQGTYGHGDEGYYAFGCTREHNWGCQDATPETVKITFK